MKNAFAIFWFAAVVFQSAAQTNNGKSEFKTTTVTNWVQPGPALRVANGTTYNIAYSKLWKDFADWEGLGKGSLGNSGHFERQICSVKQVKGTTVMVDILKAESWPETYTGVTQELGTEYLRSVIILNYPNPESLVTAEGVHCRCMKTTNYLNSAGISFRAYDCGVQATNRVPVIKEVKNKTTSPNSATNQ